eukprot:tig00001181_g7447.t1
MYMNSNQLTVIPPAIGQLTCLQKLIIDNNKLRALPPEIGNLINLTQLNASSNKLSTIPREIGRLASLQLLNVCNNELAELPQEIAQLEGLQGQDEHGTALLEYLRSLRAAAGSATLPIASDRDDSFAFRNQPAPPSTAVVAASSNSTPACSSSALLVQSSAIGSLSLNATTVFEWIRNLENSLLAAREAAEVCLEDKPPVARRAIQPCGHVCCESCVQRLASAGQPCPICRGALQGFIPIFE